MWLISLSGCSWWMYVPDKGPARAGRGPWESGNVSLPPFPSIALYDAETALDEAFSPAEGP